MPMTTKRIFGFGSPSRYIQGPGVLEELNKYTENFGKRVYIICDTFFYNDFIIKMKKIYSSAGQAFKMKKFGGEVTVEEINDATTEGKDFNADIIVGIGGGKVIDTAKNTAFNLNLPIIIAPTTASTDAPCSALAIIYKKDGTHSHVNWFNKNPDIVLVDSQIIAKAPVRFLVSGMGDALSTWFEARANAESDTVNYVNMQLKAKIAAEKRALTPALENIIETNTLMSGLGFENTGCAGAHSIADGLTELSEGVKMLHGEKVAFGVIVQIVAENRPFEEIKEVIKFCLSIGLPVTLEDLHVEETKENIKTIAKASMGSFWSSEPFNVTSEMVEDYIIAADALGHKFKSKDIL